MLALLAAAIVIPLTGLVATSAQAATPLSLRDPVKREIAQEIITSAENSHLNWYDYYDYIEDIDDGRGYTGGIVGFTSGTHDMLVLVENYTKKYPNNPLAKYIPALRNVDGTESHAGLGTAFETAWKAEGKKPEFQRAQRDETKVQYFDPSVNLAISDKLGPLGQFAYYDAAVVHGFDGLEDIRTQAKKKATTPASGGNETTYLNAFLDARVVEMKKEAAHEDVSRIENAQRVWLNAGNLNLNTPLSWSVYGDPFSIPTDPTPRWPNDDGTTPTPTPTPTSTPTSTPTQNPGTATLISKNKPVTTSSSEGSGFEGAKAVDGNATSRWSSVEGVDPQWIRIDLGAGSKVDKVVLKWEAAYASKYRVEISADGTTWTTLATEAAGNGATDEFTNLNGTGRYLRIYGTARGTSYGYSLFEVEAYTLTSGGTPTATPTPTPTPTQTSTPTPTPTPTSTANPAATLISKNKPATTSSVESAEFDGAKAVDGNATSRWSSVEGVDPQWIRIDLGDGAKVNKVVLKWEAAYASKYRIELSADGTTWTTLATEAAGNGATDEFTGLNGTGRYLRIYGTARGTAYGYSLFEVEAYGTAGSTPNPGTGFTVVAAGDIAGQGCTTRGKKVTGEFPSDCKHFETFDRAQAINPVFYITLGDMQYDDAKASDFSTVYAKSWGTVKGNTWPIPGNHETYDDYDNLDPKAYRDYFGNRATPQGKMYYSYDYSNWHFIALDSNTFTDQAQLNWLAADLASNTKQCVVAYMHHPAFSSGDHGNEPASQPVWKMLANANVELVLSGHDHDYERFNAMNASGAASSSGTVQIVSGLGGHEMRDFGNTKANSAKRINTAYGVSKLDFTDTSVTHSFVDIGGTVLDTNTITCH
ncbi:chitosanase [Microbacterium sp. OVT16B]|uniref:chitosanase n=1 Tax=Microbacterium sp. OVT16B TaxID=2862682 RepID=UPI001CC099DE|nr:chitosanase [Microbacterium sp. OVT16B]